MVQVALKKSSFIDTLTLLSHGERRSDASSMGLVFAKASVIVDDAESNKRRLTTMNEHMNNEQVVHTGEWGTVKEDAPFLLCPCRMKHTTATST